MVLYFPSGVTFSLRGVNISSAGDGRVIITDINPNGENNEDALICRSEIPLFGAVSNKGDWYLHPTQMSTDDADRINPVNNIIANRGWRKKRDNVSEVYSKDHRVVRLKRVSDTAEEGVFTCDIGGDLNSPKYLGIYYPSE